MNLERERKFLVDFLKLPQEWLNKLEIGEGVRKVLTGYFTEPEDPAAVRASIGTDLNGENVSAKTCFKGPGTIERLEFEYRIPPEDAVQLIELTPAKIRKRRLRIDGWEIDFFDEFHRRDKFKGVIPIVAEWEEEPGKPELQGPLPNWIIKEVTEDPRYTNQSIAWFGWPKE